MEVDQKLLAEVTKLEETVIGKMPLTQREQYRANVVKLRRECAEKISKVAIKYVFDGSAKKIEDDQRAMNLEKIEVEAASLRARRDLANGWLKLLKR